MNFFVHQERARRTTVRLVVLMGVAVAALVTATYLMVAGVFVVVRRAEGVPAAMWTVSWWQPELFVAVTAGVAAVVGGGSAFKAMQLSGGGGRLATLLGGRLLMAETTDPFERKILNVVEEMAIAAGLPMPPVYLLDHEPGINAFAAGVRLDDAVIGVTRGAVETLSRDELQGVMAHEFSHILNGDMRLNVRLIAIVHGILVLGLLGYYLVRIALETVSDDRDSKNNALPVVFVVLGLGLVVVGSVGTFVGSLLKAAVSRQREFLADASAVQFTRNPPGLAGALAKIAAAETGSRIQARHAAEVSHMFFASGLTSLFATHPPLAERIRRLDAEAAPAAAAPGSTGDGPDGALASLAGGFRSGPVPMGAAVASIGAPTQVDLLVSQGLLAGAPGPLLEAVREPFGCRAVVYGLLLSPPGDVRSRQLVRLAPLADAADIVLLRRLQPLIDALPRRGRLPLVDLAVPTLKRLSAPQYRRFREAVRALIEADGRLDLFEWVLRKIVIRHLDAAFGEPSAAGKTTGRAGPADVAVVLSGLAHAGARDGNAAATAFARGAAATGVGGLALAPRERTAFADLDRSLDLLAGIRPASRRRLMDGVVATVSHDGTATPDEVELVRGVASALDCPMPPDIGVTATSA